MSAEDSSLVMVSSYSTLENLAHRPRGTPAKHPLRVFQLNNKTGAMTLLHVLMDDKECLNPAFIRLHPSLDLAYVVTEDVTQENRLLTYTYSSSSGRLEKIGSVGAGGKSTCYIYPSRDESKLLLVNYWDSSINTFGMDSFGIPRTMVASQTCRTADSAAPQQHGDDPHGGHRTKETHAHAVVLDPAHARVAYVPDLGKDCIHQFVFNQETGKLAKAGTLISGQGNGPFGPRYIEFHPWLDIAYVVNELSSTVAVFEFNPTFAKMLQPGSDQQTLTLVQTVNTVPVAFPRRLNTCGRITVHGSGKWLLVSNRGHDSIAVYSVDTSGTRGLTGSKGSLNVVNYCHTRGHTPRHFKFDSTGRWLLAANQDSDSLSVFAFDANTGLLQFKDSYTVPSPNFVQTRELRGTRRPQSKL